MAAPNWTGAAIQATSDIASSALGAVFAKKAAKKSFNRSVTAYKHRYQWTMEDMRKAGLNPILAAGQGAGSAPSAPVATRSGGTSDYTSAIQKSSRLSAEMKLLGAQTNAARAAGAKSAAEMGTVEGMREHLVNSARANAQLTNYGLNFAENDSNYYGTGPGRVMQQIGRAREAAGLVGAGAQSAASLWGFLGRPSPAPRKPGKKPEIKPNKKGKPRNAQALRTVEKIRKLFGN